MTQLQPMRDVIVVVPGILGSVLVKDGREVWGAPGKSAISNLVSLGGALKGLKLSPELAMRIRMMASAHPECCLVLE